MTTRKFPDRRAAGGADDAQDIRLRVAARADAPAGQTAAATARPPL